MNELKEENSTKWRQIPKSFETVNPQNSPTHSEYKLQQEELLRQQQAATQANQKIDLLLNQVLIHITLHY